MRLHPFSVNRVNYQEGKSLKVKVNIAYLHLDYLPFLNIFSYLKTDLRISLNLSTLTICTCTTQAHIFRVVGVLYDPC